MFLHKYMIATRYESPVGDSLLKLPDTLVWEEGVLQRAYSSWR